MRYRQAPQALTSQAPPPPPPPSAPPQSRTVLPPPPPGPPPAGAVRVDVPWSQVVRTGSAGNAVGPGFAVPFEPWASAWQVEDQVDCCFMESGPDLRAMEEELSRAVVVTVVGPRQAAHLAAAAEAIRVEFELGPLDMSIRPYFPEDFLILCRSKELRDRMVRRGPTGTQQFDLLLRPWLRQAGATGIRMPFLVPLALRGVPANAWTRRTADVLLHGLGVVIRVAASTESRSDMDGFKVWLRTDDPARIPPRRILVVEEPDRRSERALAAVGVDDALWYPISIVQEGPVVQVGQNRDVAAPPPPSPSSGNGGQGGAGGAASGGANSRYVGARQTGHATDRAPPSQGHPEGSSSASAPTPARHCAGQRAEEAGERARPCSRGPISSDASAAVIQEDTVRQEVPESVHKPVVGEHVEASVEISQVLSAESRIGPREDRTGSRSVRATGQGGVGIWLPEDSPRSINQSGGRFSGVGIRGVQTAPPNGSPALSLHATGLGIPRGSLLAHGPSACRRWARQGSK